MAAGSATRARAAAARAAVATASWLKQEPIGRQPRLRIPSGCSLRSTCESLQSRRFRRTQQRGPIRIEPAKSEQSTGGRRSDRRGPF
eukprot:scaffold32406_cov70-Phaeocystis_antarctica.AAC.2